jgi:glycosyltransferase involved in cell wall biosynthesis
LPAWTSTLHQRCRSHLDRPERYEIDGVITHSPRVLFSYGATLRSASALLAPESVASFASKALQPALWQCIEENRPDALLIHGALPWGNLARAAKEKLGLPFALIEHSQSDLLRLQPGDRLERYYRGVAGQSEATLVVGPAMRHHLQQIGWQRVHLLRHGLNPTPESSPSERRPSRLDDKLVILAAANYCRRKGLEELTAAFRAIAGEFPEAVLCIVSELPARLAQQLRPWRESGRIELLGPLPPTELAPWMGWADLFALPSWSEAFGLVFLEALSAGTPALMSSDCGLQSLLSERAWWREHPIQDLVVKPRSVTALVEALRQALKSRERLQQWGKQVQQWVHAEFRNAHPGADLLQHLQLDPRSFKNRPRSPKHAIPAGASSPAQTVRRRRRGPRFSPTPEALDAEPRGE